MTDRRPAPAATPVVAPVVTPPIDPVADHVAGEIQALVNGRHTNPHQVLGLHGDLVRTWRPDAKAVDVVLPDGTRVTAERIHDAGLFEAVVPSAAAVAAGGYQLAVTYEAGEFVVDDPYRFWPTLGDLDLYLYGEGRHETLWRVMGAHLREHQGVAGASFAVWAPSAQAVRVVADFNGWDGRTHPMRMLGSSGVWELFIPAVEAGHRYKFELVAADGSLILKTDPFAFATEVPPSTAAIVAVEGAHTWADQEWMERRAATDAMTSPMSVYEMHLASWRRVPEEGNRSLTYREMAEWLPDYLVDMGFTHVEMMPVAEHPFSGSWGYQVSCYYAPTSRFGSPDDFRFLVDALHARNIGVIVDWVPAHFPKDAFALARFDGTALYEHADPRQGEHPDWGTLVFNFGRHEVSNFLLANALFWMEEFHIDGLRVDAVASMLYLDYSRKEGEWLPNKFGGRENLEAVDFLRRMNELVYGNHPGAITMAEESTAWPAVSRPTYLGGLGFGFKWNMGWMHDTLEYFSKPSIYRTYHHHHLTFGLLYAFTENFVLPLSHDEVVHGKGSLLDKMPGEGAEKFAQLRCLYAWMWAHPGKQLLFMGCELAQGREWAHDGSVEWDLLQWPEHAGVHHLVRRMNAVYGAEPALFERDFDPSGFRWIDANDADQNVISFARMSADGSRSLVCVANLSGSDRPGYRIGVTQGGWWRTAIDTQSPEFSGWGPGHRDHLCADGIGWHGLDQSIAVDLPALTVLWLVPADQ
ncbi:MAG: 1,4-alpha-glucan branching enzyme [Actinomycetota bacterium]|jgi:1,4-alpha-glucan branching enzyme|nr:1,4-alpha-glucan branching enzyme [Actinomycetota bacterium]